MRVGGFGLGVWVEVGLGCWDVGLGLDGVGFIRLLSPRLHFATGSLYVKNFLPNPIRPPLEQVILNK